MISLQFCWVYHAQFPSNKTELIITKWFGEDICKLLLSWDKFHLDILFLDMIPQKMMSHINVLGPGMMYRTFGQADGAGVVT